MSSLLLASLLSLAPPLVLGEADPPDRLQQLAATYVEAVEKLNATHARKPGKRTEAQLAADLPRKASKALEKLLDAKQDEDLGEPLERCARAALELDRVEDFDSIRERLLEQAPDRARGLGLALSRERFLLLGEGGLELAYLEDFAPILEDVLRAYDEVFGFEEFSKVPGKKLRVRLRLVESITSPPHFAPQFPYHSEIDFPVIDPQVFRSPTEKGQFLFYGMCHELGHVIAMWGGKNQQEDHHAWAHYTGLVIVEHLARAKREPAWLEHCRDLRWRSLELERERLAQSPAGTADRDAVLALLLGLHDLVGPRAIGDAINELDLEDARLRINRVRYYSFRELQQTLVAASKKKQRKAIEALFAGD